MGLDAVRAVSKGTVKAGPSAQKEHNRQAVAKRVAACADGKNFPESGKSWDAGTVPIQARRSRIGDVARKLKEVWYQSYWPVPLRVTVWDGDP